MTGKSELDHQLAQLRAQLQSLEALRAVLGDAATEQSTAPLRRRIANLETRIETAGGAAIAGDVTVKRGDFVGRDKIVRLYQVYLASPGKPILSKAGFTRILGEYLRTVRQAHDQARLYGLESLRTAQARPNRGLKDVFIPLTLCRFRPPRREELEELAGHKDDHLAMARACVEWADRQREEAKPVPQEEILTVADRIAIVGGAGSGKSTLLSYLAVVLAAAMEEGILPPLDLPGPEQVPVPLLIPLRYYRDYQNICGDSPQERVKDPRAKTLAGFLPWYLKRRYPVLDISEDFLDRLLQGRGCLIMLDGLDEVVSREERGQVRQEVEDLINSNYPGNRVIVTAREAGYREEAVFGDDFVRLDVQRLEEGEIRALVGNWCRQLYPGEEKTRTEELVQAIAEINARRADRHQPPLISTPLLTTMVVSVKWGETDLPRERAKLYEAGVKVILQAQYVPDDAARREMVDWGGPWEAQREWLSILALAMHEGGRDGAAIREERLREILAPHMDAPALDRFVQAVRYRGGLLEERAEFFQFVHLTFQEFLAARLLTKRRREGWAHLRPHVSDPWWREVLLLTHGFAQADYPPAAQEYVEWLSSLQGRDRLAGLEAAGAAVLELDRPETSLRQKQARRLVAALTERGLPAPAVLRARAGDVLSGLGDVRFRADAFFLPDEPLLGFVEVPAGSFLMGSRNADKMAYGGEKPQHELTLPTYYIARYPVTVAQFRAFVEASGHKVADEDSLRGGANHPVVNMAWHDALAYCRWLTQTLRAWTGTPEALAGLLQGGWVVTLPSEAEWEKAARGTDGRTYPWGSEWADGLANTDEAGIGGTCAVGCFPDGASPCGCLDMAGNTWEWTRNLWGKRLDKPDFGYPYDFEDGREDLAAGDEVWRVVRGGSWLYSSRLARCAYRLRLDPVLWLSDFGFRVVFSPAP